MWLAALSRVKPFHYMPAAAIAEDEKNLSQQPKYQFAWNAILKQTQTAQNANSLNISRQKINNQFKQDIYVVD